jgi:hypothetical protein
MNGSIICLYRISNRSINLLVLDRNRSSKTKSLPLAWCSIRNSTWVCSGLACTYLTKTEGKDSSDKYSSLLQAMIVVDEKFNIPNRSNKTKSLPLAWCSIRNSTWVCSDLVCTYLTKTEGMDSSAKYSSLLQAMIVVDEKFNIPFLLFCLFIPQLFRRIKVPSFRSSRLLATQPIFFFFFDKMKGKT